VGMCKGGGGSLGWVFWAETNRGMWVPVGLESVSKGISRVL
jgi:hypothetical protein